MDPREVQGELYRVFAGACGERQGRILALLDACNAGDLPPHQALESVAIELHDHIGDAKLIALDKVSAAASELEQLIRQWKNELLPQNDASSIDESLRRSIHSETFRSWLQRLTTLSRLFAENVGDEGQLEGLQKLRQEIRQALTGAGDERSTRETLRVVPKRQRHIVVLDDSQISRRLVASAVEELGHVVHTAGTLAQFWQLVGGERRPEAIFLDFNMPEMRGDHLCQKLRGDERFAELPIIIISSLTDDQLQAISMRVGASGYISKQRGLSAIREYVDRLVGDGIL